MIFTHTHAYIANITHLSSIMHPSHFLALSAIVETSEIEGERIIVIYRLCHTLTICAVHNADHSRTQHTFGECEENRHTSSHFFSFIIFFCCSILLCHTPNVWHTHRQFFCTFHSFFISFTFAIPFIVCSRVCFRIHLVLISNKLVYLLPRHCTVFFSEYAFLNRHLFGTVSVWMFRHERVLTINLP